MKPPATAESKAKRTNKHIQSAANEPDVFYLKVVDTELNDKMIAGAKWRINEQERTQEQIQSMLPVPDDTESAASKDFQHYLCRVRKQFMNTKPFYCESN